MGKIRITKYGVFKEYELVIGTDYSEVEFDNGGRRIRCVETIKKSVCWEPVLLWNPKGYFNELKQSEEA